MYDSLLNECSFIRILNRQDRIQFLKYLNDKYYNEILTTKQIKLSIWINIMRSIKLNIDYIIYKKPYLGKNINANRCVVQILTIRSNNFYFSNKPVKRILLNDNIMEEFEIDYIKNIHILPSWWYKKKDEFIF